MRLRIYEAKTILRRPLVWYGRVRHANVDEATKFQLEHNQYRRVAWKAMAAKSIDRQVFHREDLDASSVVLDVGAFQGRGAEDLYGLYGCKVYAFEPAPQFYRDLEARFAHNADVMTLPYGLGAADATMTMQLAGPGSTVHDGGRPDTGTVEVEIRDIARVLDDLGLDRIDLMKINIEGGEYDLLERMAEADLIPRVRYFLIQFHEWYGNANVRRWRIRRQLRASHTEVWNYPWMFELWCAKDEPHPQLELTRDQRKQIVAELRAEAAARDAAATESR
jgi:FkbM family methyltransferase